LFHFTSSQIVTLMLGNPVCMCLRWNRWTRPGDPQPLTPGLLLPPRGLVVLEGEFVPVYTPWRTPPVPASTTWRAPTTPNARAYTHYPRPSLRCPRPAPPRAQPPLRTPHSTAIVVCFLSHKLLFLRLRQLAQVNFILNFYIFYWFLLYNNLITSFSYLDTIVNRVIQLLCVSLKSFIVQNLNCMLH
jgi:hypothetical protein